MRTIPALLDTDILSAIMRRNPVMVSKAREYLREHHRFTFSILTRYEILRGLKAKGASKQEHAFESFCDANTVLPLSDDIIVQAAAIYADLHRRGELIGDADILIGTTALVQGFGVVTNNVSHFGRIKGLFVESWLSSS
ncbi:MAG: type II toxin-antitoxin system VapC family toxin [Candidatus Latescibacteria bacterium]|nr:type II toxin-antitoxin system VapC family toxin [Candidatus Latescibacterota bacterium]